MERTSISSRQNDAAYKQRQQATPILTALKNYKQRRVVPFDVPGHKQGRGTPDLRAFLGETCVSIDVNSSKPLDNLCHPVSVIKEAEALAAEAFGADSAFFLVNGTTSAVQAMILGCCGEGDKIIMPRNVHRSAINAVILSGAVPVYVNPGIHSALGIPLGMSLKDVEKYNHRSPGRQSGICQQPDVLRHMLRSCRHHCAGASARHAGAGRRSTRHALLFSCGHARRGHACGRGHGGRQHS